MVFFKVNFRVKNESKQTSPHLQFQTDFGFAKHELNEVCNWWNEHSIEWG